ncbi:hypothetical protein A0H81_09885, partial [Grifola frondosa]
MLKVVEMRVSRSLKGHPVFSHGIYALNARRRPGHVLYLHHTIRSKGEDVIFGHHPVCSASPNQRNGYPQRGSLSRANWLVIAPGTDSQCCLRTSIAQPYEQPGYAGAQDVGVKGRLINLIGAVRNTDA